MKAIGPFKKNLKAFHSPQVHKYVGLNVGSPFQILMGCGNAIQLVAKYDVKEVITLLMTNFDHLNPTIQAMPIMPSDGLDGVVIEIEEENTNFLVLEHPQKNLPKHLLLGELFYFGGYFFHSLSVKILLLCVGPIRIGFQMLTSLLNNYSGFLGLKLNLKNV